LLCAKKMGRYTAALLLIALAITARGQNQNYVEKIKTGYKGDTIAGLQTMGKSLGFCVIGDWGRHGEFYQKVVAEQLGNASVGVNASFIISTGDNIYPNGVASELDPSWQTAFENVYTAQATHVPWYVVLGNHDYRTNPDAEVAYTKISARWKMPARYYSIRKSIAGDTAQKAEFFFIDTSPYQQAYYKEDDYAAKVVTADTAAQKKWLENALKNSTATWKFVVGHHPLYSAGGRKGKTQDMENGFKNLFEQYKVDAYLCGHEHHLEYDEPEGVHFVEFISGAGSEATAVSTAPYAKFALQEFGFLTVNVTAAKALFQFINWQGKVVYTTQIKK